MITANFMNVASVKNGKIQPAATKKSQGDNIEAAEAFAGIMNQTMDVSNFSSEESYSDMGVSKDSNTSSSFKSYDRYSYKSNRIEQAERFTATEKLEESVDTLEQAAEEVVKTICEAYNVDEEEVQNMLDEMELHPLDLLNPQNLVSFLVNLTGAESGEQLLWDANFLKVMESVNSITENLMSHLDVDANNLQELIAQMNIVNATESEEASPMEEILEMPLEQAETTDDTIAETEMLQESVNVNEKTDGHMTQNSVSESMVEEAKTSETEAKVSENVTTETMISDESVAKEMDAAQTKTAETTEQFVQQTDVHVSEAVIENVSKDMQNLEVKTDNLEETSEIKVQIVKDGNTSENGASEKEFSFTEDNRSSENNSLLHQNTDANQAIFTNQMSVNTNQTMDVPQMQFSPYLSADTMQIMEQVVQQMKVNVTTEMTSMEMQMNPENLGKIFVNISTEEGIVNAKFQATNEVVKEALEIQIATLRENLNQAGVKVDAIEVTIASHEFERNLEQNQQNPEEQTDANVNAQSSRRRNLTIDSLDELSGLMTEEESLVAQIMKDNGNSVDLTA